MSNQPQTTTNATTEPRLCKQGCGFFGSGATGDCCSKCWNDLQKKQGGGVAEPPTEMELAPAPAIQCLPVAEPTPMEVDTLQEEEVVVEIVAESASTPLKKKNNKKASYKSMMASMLQSSSPSRDLEQEKESLRKVTGGGAFSKIDKI